MNGTQSPDAQKASNANTNGGNSNNSSLAAKKRKKDLKPIITMEGTNQPAGCCCGYETRSTTSMCLVMRETDTVFRKDQAPFHSYRQNGHSTNMARHCITIQKQ
ncbi:uncharacterized protein BKA55DRAFT_545137 [Fusarium redolens]|uniref:Uncharacterized protein n=1 Tax=Fusarium redolens TaxID=48865 RepID=A0A9P9G1U9_FUSRE|nr:uncharacterized protein BKA55DRAFT_545137 [Fusarium redolens]KAH7230432.1 hypothetical protein BKA55DRAFT_545137 [Fusarium redolens]